MRSAAGRLVYTPSRPARHPGRSSQRHRLLIPQKDQDDLKADERTSRVRCSTPPHPSRLTNVITRGSVSLTVFPAVELVGLGGREPVAEGDSEGVQDGLPADGPLDAAGAGRV